MPEEYGTRKYKVIGTSGGLGLVGLCLGGPVVGIAGAVFGGLLSNAVIPEEDRPWVNVASLIAEGETSKIEFKSSLLNSNGKISDKLICGLAAIANTSGGNMLIGVTDDREVCGIEPDLEKYKTRDKWLKALFDKIDSDIGTSFHKYFRARFVDYQDKTLCQIEVTKPPKKVFCKKIFYQRQGNQTVSPSHEEYDKIMRSE